MDDSQYSYVLTLPSFTIGKGKELTNVDKVSIYYSEEKNNLCASKLEEFVFNAFNKAVENHTKIDSSFDDINYTSNLELIKVVKKTDLSVSCKTLNKANYD